ncbi:hypothetical protein PCE1_001469 [Barthelona sp. PCE]
MPRQLGKKSSISIKKEGIVYPKEYNDFQLHKGPVFFEDISSIMLQDKYECCLYDNTLYQKQLHEDDESIKATVTFFSIDDNDGTLKELSSWIADVPRNTCGVVGIVEGVFITLYKSDWIYGVFKNGVRQENSVANDMKYFHDERCISWIDEFNTDVALFDMDTKRFVFESLQDSVILALVTNMPGCYIALSVKECSLLRPGKRDFFSFQELNELVYLLSSNPNGFNCSSCFVSVDMKGNISVNLTTCDCNTYCFNENGIISKYKVPKYVNNPKLLDNLDYFSLSNWRLTFWRVVSLYEHKFLCSDISTLIYKKGLVVSETVCGCFFMLDVYSNRIFLIDDSDLCVFEYLPSVNTIWFGFNTDMDSKHNFIVKFEDKKKIWSSDEEILFFITFDRYVLYNMHTKALSVRSLVNYGEELVSYSIGLSCKVYAIHDDFIILYRDGALYFVHADSPDRITCTIKDVAAVIPNPFNPSLFIVVFPDRSVVHMYDCDLREAMVLETVHGFGKNFFFSRWCFAVPEKGLFRINPHDFGISVLLDMSFDGFEWSVPENGVLYGISILDNMVLSRKIVMNVWGEIESDDMDRFSLEGCIMKSKCFNS